LGRRGLILEKITSASGEYLLQRTRLHSHVRNNLPIRLFQCQWITPSAIDNPIDWQGTCLAGRMGLSKYEASLTPEKD
jgi:hypothetical protein